MNVMVIDMLEGFTRIGALANPRVAKLIPRQVKFLSNLPKGSTVVFLCDEHSTHDLEFKRFPPHCIIGTDETTICRELTEAIPKGVTVHKIVKSTFNGFYRTYIDDQLGRLLYKNNWTVFGCVTDCCIEANVAELVYRGNEITVLSKLTDTWDMSIKAVQENNLPSSAVHNANNINEYWFKHRLPSVWGVTVL
jgi:nicotinamidase-related amidase